MKSKEELYALQKKCMEGSIFSEPFVSRDFRCYSCGKNLFENGLTLSEAEAGILITGCRLCHKSFCD